MKKGILALTLVAAAGLGFVPAQDVQKFPTGAKRTPFPNIVAAIKGGKAHVYQAKAPPPQVITVPKRLSMWGNSQYGDCVSAESAFAIADYSTFLGLDEIFVTEPTIIAWAGAHGFLNGADLLEVIQAMQADGVKDEKGVLRKAGTPATVDYRTESVLQSAIAQGPVSIAIDASALPSGAGNKSGWYAFGGRSYPNTDHCVSLHGYGPTSELFKALGVAPPANAPASGYLLYTWSTIGVVDHAWIMNTVTEAWVRNPTTTGLTPPPPPPPVLVVSVTMPAVTGTVGQPVRFTPTAVGGTAPYLFSFSYGDGVMDQSGSHTYKTAGTFTASVTAVDATGLTGTGTAQATITSGPTPPPTPQGLIATFPSNVPAGSYNLVLPADLDEIQRRLDSIRGKGFQLTPP